MTAWICADCGATREGRCKPQKCPSCEQKGTFVKAEEGTTPDPEKE